MGKRGGGKSSDGDEMVRGTSLRSCSSRQPKGRSPSVVKIYFSPRANHLVGLVVKALASRAEDPGFQSRLRRDFSGSSHTSDLKIGTLVATLPGAWRYRVSAVTGRPGVSIQGLGEM